MRSTNAITILIILIVIALAVFLSDGFNSQKFAKSKWTPETIAGTCCDQGDGDQCSPYTTDDKTFTLNKNSHKYGLLKSDITLTEAIYHLQDSGQTHDGHPIILNSTDGYSNNIRECGGGHNDQVWGKNGCFAVPNDEIVYVCKDHCGPAPQGTRFCGILGVSCYGSENTKYDAYFDLSQYPAPGIPDPIKNCTKSINPQGKEPGQEQIVMDNDKNTLPDLQLKTFHVVTQAGAIPWLSPYCKPAIYLYPTQKTEVSVKVNPKEPFTATIPSYPENGWDVTAFPNGTLWSNNASFPYLYYETKVPDNLVSHEKTGYVVEYSKLRELFETLLPKLGLNTHESADFANYWEKALPKSNYYLVQVEPRETLDEVAPLSIQPTPDTLIRVTLYFQPLDKKIDIQDPQLPTISRTGFTVIEWGGLFKQDKNHPFTCLM